MSSNQIEDYIIHAKWDEVENMVRSNSDALKDDRHLLIDALYYSKPPTYSLVCAIIEADPEQAKTNYGGYYPLHNAINKGHKSNIILLIFDAYPDAAKQKCKNGWFPIHRAVEKKCSLKVIMKLVESYEEGLSKDFNGDLPLYIAINSNYDSVALSYLIEKCPQAVSCTNSDGQYPIHKALENKYSFEVIMKLVEVYGDGLKEYVSDQLPLHIALDNNYDSSMVLYLIKTYPQSAGRKSQCGQYPIHKAIENNFSVEVITTIAQEYKDGLNKCFNGDLPLHVAIKNNCDSATLIFLVEKSPQSMIARNKHGQYPIELLMIHDYPNDTICDLLKTHKDGMKLFHCSKFPFAQFYKDMLSRFVEKYYIEYFDIANTLCYLLSNMVHESSNDKDVLSYLDIDENSKGSTDEQCADSFTIERKMHVLNKDLLEKIDAFINDKTSSIDESMHELSDRIKTVKNDVDELRNERDGFVLCDEEMTEVFNPL